MDLVQEIGDVADVRELRNFRRMDQIFRNRRCPFQLLNDVEFRKRYRLSKECARYVLTLIEDQLTVPCRNFDSSSSLQFLVALRFYSKGCYQTELGKLLISSLQEIYS
ncbi:hypothetical protein ABEB36_015505 [Hypothenemus hampei]|uniref:Uncharacterized protein n=1 Tax=Hypothenemus hampei TaxID=57062 RepID=A0ABD1E0J7_HYPHA